MRAAAEGAGMETPPTDTTEDATARALDEALPLLRSTRRLGWGLIGLAVAGPAIVTVAHGWFGWLIFGGLGVFGIAGWVRSRHERMLLPIVAGVFGLTHAKGEADCFAALPEPFIPRGARRSADDTISGQIAGRTFRFAEVRTATGGKNSRTLFRGIVLQLACRPGLPPFLIADERQTKGFLFSRGNVPVEGMIPVMETRSREGETYGLWTRDPAARDLPGLGAFLDRMVAIGEEVLGTARLYALACTGTDHFVALSHDADLFAVGGLLADEASIMADIRRASEEVAHTVELVAEILRAEEALIAAAPA